MTNDISNKFRPIPFWSWNDKLDVSETLFQVEEMDKKGMGGFFMHARGGLETEYMGKEWFDNVNVCVEKCRQNGMKAWAYDENGWPSGFGNSIVNSKGVFYQQKYLRFEKGEKTTDTTIANIDGYHFYYEVNPFYVDILNENVVKDFIENIYQPYYDKFKEGLEGFFTDEPQLSRKGIVWSFVLPKEYEKEYGEDLLKKLPHLFFKFDGYKQTRIKFWKLVTKLFSKSYMKQIYDWCNEHNYKFTGHLLFEETLQSQLAPNGACMPHYEYMTIPGIDWLGRKVSKSLTPYQVSSVARQMGKKQVISETFALAGHNIGHDELKWIYEHLMVRGINLLCQHLQGYSIRGLRKRDYPPAMYIQQSWWKDYRIFNDAMSRIGMMLTKGDDNVEVLVIHPQTTAWTMYNGDEIYDNVSGEGIKNITKLNDEFIDVLLTLERKHINFHLGDEIIMERHAHIENNKFIIGKKSYSKVIIPKSKILFENTQKLIDEFKANGGLIISAEEIEDNDIINIPEIAYCERSCEDYNMYYFVNSTENTYDAYISKGNKVMDIVTGELSDFDGHYQFKKYESLVVIDDFGKRNISEKKSKLVPINLDGEWKIINHTENILTLDYCDYYFDGVLQEKNGYVLNAMYRALNFKKAVNIKCEFKFKAEYLPEKLHLVCENPKNFDIKVNGKDADKTDCGYFLDKSFRKIDISKNVVIGKNTITMTMDFMQSKKVYENLEKAKVFETEKNKLTFDMELEQIYLTGNFAVDICKKIEELDKNACRVEGNFVITKPKESITLLNVERQGFPFFAGDITVEKHFRADSTNMMLDFVKCGFNVVKAKVNDSKINTFLWEPYTLDVSDYISIGDNKIELTLTNNLRNMQGPFHLNIGESYAVCPNSFYKEKCVWYNGDDNKRWNDNYCFANLCVSERK